MTTITEVIEKNQVLLKKIEFDSIPIPVAIHNRYGEIHSTNWAFKNCFKQNKDYNLEDIFPGFRNIFSKNKTDKYITFRDKKKSTKGYKITSTIIDNDQFVSYIQDVSDLIQKNITLSNSSHTKEKFIKVISHDLKNPLTAIHGFADLLFHRYNEYDNTTQLHFLKLILESSSQCSELISNLMYWTKSESKEILTRIEQIDIADLIDDCINFVLPISKSKDIVISFAIKDTKFISCDKNLTSTIIRNLLSNAIKYTNRNGKIKVVVNTKDNQVNISVTDNGIGISRAKLLSLHTNNIQESELGTEQEIGSGIGLKIVKDFIKLQKGTFGIESELQKGTKIWFTIPQ